MQHPGSCMFREFILWTIEDLFIIKVIFWFNILDWQECYDEQTGYPYYWHTETNQVTWEVPPELKALKEKQSQNQAGTPHGSHIPQWPNMASNKCI